MIVAGLYSVLWGKYRENKEKKEMEAMVLPIAVKGVEGNVQMIDDIEVDEVQLEKAKANKKFPASTMELAVVSVSVPEVSTKEEAQQQKA